MNFEIIVTRNNRTTRITRTIVRVLPIGARVNMDTVSHGEISITREIMSAHAIAGSDLRFSNVSSFMEEISAGINPPMPTYVQRRLAGYKLGDVIPPVSAGVSQDKPRRQQRPRTESIEELAEEYFDFSEDARDASTPAWHDVAEEVWDIQVDKLTDEQLAMIEALVSDERYGEYGFGADVWQSILDAQ